jgi:hypothetical protein
MVDVRELDVLRRARVILGFALAPAVLPLGAILLSPSGDTALPLVLIPSYVCSLLFGIPAYLFFRRLEWLAWWQVLLGGLACLVPVALLYVAFAGGFGTPHIQRYGLHNILVLAPFTTGTAGIFWVIAIWRNEGAASAHPVL